MATYTADMISLSAKIQISEHAVMWTDPAMGDVIVTYGQI